MGKISVRQLLARYWQTIME